MLPFNSEKQLKQLEKHWIDFQIGNPVSTEQLRNSSVKSASKCSALASS